MQVANMHFLFKWLLIGKYFSQVPPVEVEFSDKPELTPLTLTHLQGPLIMVWALGIGAASMAWLAELSVGAIQNRKKRVTNVTFLPKLQCFIP